MANVEINNGNKLQAALPPRKKSSLSFLQIRRKKSNSNTEEKESELAEDHSIPNDKADHKLNEKKTETTKNRDGRNYDGEDVLNSRNAGKTKSVQVALRRLSYAN